MRLKPDEAVDLAIDLIIEALPDFARRFTGDIVQGDERPCTQMETCSRDDGLSLDADPHKWRVRLAHNRL